MEGGRERETDRQTDNREVEREEKDIKNKSNKEKKTLKSER